MKHLIAIVTNHKPEYAAKAEAQRQTWATIVRAYKYADVVFFRGAKKLGRSESVICVDGNVEEVWLDVPDSYSGLPAKVQAIYRWALERGYDYITKCDDDVYVVPHRLPDLDIRQHDYVGTFCAPTGGYPAWYASGFFYTLSSRAARIVADAAWNGDWCDERFVGNILACFGIYGRTCPDAYAVSGPHIRPQNILNDCRRYSTVFCEYGARDMYAMHAALQYAPILQTWPTRKVLHGPVSYAQIAQPPTDEIPERHR